MKRLKKVISLILLISLVITPVFTVLADSTKIITLGANLSLEQRELMLNYFGVRENEVEIITVTNEDEHRYLDGIATQEQIGKRTFSCAYIEPTNEGGINIKTVNLTWVTCDMLRNALITSGITNCNVICASPIEVSGTGALTGIFIAYENINNIELSNEKVEIASEELIATMEIAEDIGQAEASELFSILKEQVLTEGVQSEEDITDIVFNYLKENKIEITEEQAWKLVDLLLKISKQDYDIEEIKEMYKNMKETVDKVAETSKKAKNIFESIWEWIKETWNKLIEFINSIINSEEYKKAKEIAEEAGKVAEEKIKSSGILDKTNESLLGDDVVITTTGEEDIIKEE